MMTGFRLNFTPLKEPLGFIKLVEWVSALGLSRSPNLAAGASLLDFFFLFFIFTNFHLVGFEKKKNARQSIRRRWVW